MGVGAVGKEGGCRWKRGGDGRMDAGIQRQPGSDCGGGGYWACFHGNLPVKGVGMGDGGGDVYLYVCNMVGQSSWAHVWLTKKIK